MKFSCSIRELLPLKILTKYVIFNLGIDSDMLKFFSRSTFYEDNNVSIVVATIPRMNPALKHISVKYNFSGSRLESNL